MEYRFWILIIKNKKNSVFIGGFKIFFKSLIAGDYMFILLLTNILTCRMQEFKSLDNLSNYNKFVYIFQAVLNIFWKLLQLHIMINFFLLEFLGGGWWSHAGFSSCGGLTSGTPGTSYSPSIWRKWRGWSKKWGRGGRFYVFGSSTRLTFIHA